MPATIVNLTDTSISVPEWLVLDTSLLIEPDAPPSGQSKNHHAACLTFLGRIGQAIRAERTLAVVPYFAYEEAIHVLLRYELSRLATARAFSDWKALYKADPNSVHVALPKIEAIRRGWQTAGFQVTDAKDLVTSMTAAPICDRMLAMARAYRIMPRDATILATAARIGIRTVATRDRDWRRADGFTVFTEP